MNVAKTPLSSSIVLAAGLLACVSASAAPACGAVSPVERRIVERANGEVDSLRSFVGLTAIVFGVNMVDVRENLDKWRAAVDCRAQVAAADEAARVAADARAADAASVHVAAR